MMERAERQVVTILEHGTLDRAHATASVGNSELLCSGPHTAAALGRNLGRNLVGHVGSKGTGTLAVAEHVHTRETHTAAQRQRLLELLVRLTRKTDDDIARKGRLGQVGANHTHRVLKGLGAIGTAHAMQGRRAAGLHGQVQKRGDTLRVARHNLKQALGDIHGLDRGNAHMRNRRALHDGLEQLIDFDMLIGRALAIVGTQVHTGQHHLGHDGLLGLANLLEHGLDGHGALGAACLPHNAIGAAMVAAVLNLHAQARATEHIDHLAIAAGGNVIGLNAQHLADTFGDIDLGRLGDHAIRKLQQLLGMQIDHASGHDHIGLVWIGQRMTDGLTGLGLGLARNGTGVNDDQIGILGLHNSKAQAHKVGSDTVRLNPVDTAAEVDDGNMGCEHAGSLIEDIVEGTLDTVGHRLLTRSDVIAHLIGKSTEQFALLIGKIGGNDHAQLHDQAATRTATANARHAVIIDAHGVAVLGAGGNRHLNDLVGHNALDLDLAAERSLRNRDIAHQVQVVTVALKALMVGNAHVDNQVARGLAAKAGLAKAAHTQLATGRNAGGNIDVDLFVRRRAALAVTGLAGMIDDRALAVAVGARRRGLDLAQKRALDRGDIARAVAAAALFFGRTVSLARTVAILAGSKAVIADRLFAAERRLLERHRKRDGHVTSATTLTTAAGATAGTAAKERREQVVHAHATKDIVDIDVARTTRAVGGAVTVVVSTLLLIGKNGIGLVELLELGLGLGVVRNVRVYGTGLL